VRHPEQYLSVHPTSTLPRLLYSTIDRAIIRFGHAISGRGVAGAVDPAGCGVVRLTWRKISSHFVNIGSTAVAQAMIPSVSNSARAQSVGLSGHVVWTVRSCAVCFESCSFACSRGLAQSLPRRNSSTVWRPSGAVQVTMDLDYYCIKTCLQAYTTHDPMS